MEVLGEASEVESSLDMVPNPVEEMTTSIDANSEAYKLQEVREIELFVGIAWWIWHDRNNAFHRGKELQASELFHKAVEWIEEWSNANVKDQQPLQSSDNDAGSLIWEAPPPSWVKLHFDGAGDVKNGRVGMGAVVLDEFGRMQGALAVPVDGTLSPLATEAVALRYGVLYCKELGFTRVEIEGDALNVLKALDCNGFDLNEIGAIIEDVKHGW
ncbi:uncharacterized protein LOC133716207 [Rosa rugosa]|uniref:uncharacterized protein LOC133716207 n=1 Tax=Rosa rugosa TaxID=74645 RepID=UPI002B40FBAC|nr:uncharacterized protein LOC133716207 [Rosa rugosa]